MNMNKKLFYRAVIVTAVFIAVIVFLYFDLGRYLTLSYLKESRESLQALYAGKRISVIAVYMLLYISVTALSLPGAAVMTLAGGALFGLVTGTVVVSFASTIGATTACFVSRYLLREWVQTRFEEKLEVINEGMEKEGSFYLFTMRLIPVFPFFVINLVMGLTKMPLIKFFWVSQIGMLAGTVVYVNAGMELSRIETLSSILSPRLILSFALLGLFPITVKKILSFYKHLSARKKGRKGVGNGRL